MICGALRLVQVARIGIPGASGPPGATASRMVSSPAADLLTARLRRAR